MQNLTPVTTPSTTLSSYDTFMSMLSAEETYDYHQFGEIPVRFQHPEKTIILNHSDINGM